MVSKESQMTAAGKLMDARLSELEAAIMLKEPKSIEAARIALLDTHEMYIDRYIAVLQSDPESKNVTGGHSSCGSVGG